LTLPIETGIRIPADDPVRLLSQVLEGMDYSGLYAAYSRNGRNPAVSPKRLFKVLVYGYMNGIYTTRGLEKACRRDINFMWLLEGDPAPDHNTLGRFRTERLTHVAEGLFAQLVDGLAELREVAFENLFVDGTKIEACANRYTFVWKKKTQRNSQKLQDKARELLSRLGGMEAPETVTAEFLGQALADATESAAKTGISFVHGTGRRKTQVQKDCEQLAELQGRQSQYERYDLLFNGRNSFSTTDPDATFMRMKEDHLGNAQLKPAYNVQIGVEGEYVVGVDISSERNDLGTLVPFLERLDREHPERRHRNIIADAGYESEENYRHLQSTGRASYIKPKDYEARRTHKHCQDIGRAENMDYDADRDVYTCAQGKELGPMAVKRHRSRSGFESESRIYGCEGCSGCPLQPRCFKGSGDKRIEVNHGLLVLREQSLRNISTPQGILLRMNRSIQVEGAFGVLKEDYRFRRFLLRGRKNVHTEYLLLCLAYNVNKLHNKIQGGRCSCLLHPLEAA
jgi:transposase